MTFLDIFLQSAVDPNKFNVYLTLGYFAMWLVGMSYVLYIRNRQRNLKQDLELMQQLLDQEVLQKDEEIAET